MNARWVHAHSLLAIGLLAACAPREWAGEESARVDEILGVGEEMPDDDAVEGNAVPREVSAERAKVAADSPKRAPSAETSRPARRRPAVRIARTRRDAVGLATDLDAVMASSAAGKKKPTETK